ncbi:hypothetical protein OF820_01910 [Oceanotoga sp. DSM 15011]|jgi:hypothetical protein|uniref:Uncharacterized protein n=1 Tax=Oceanotoga teriensis TaxID=515440 RepID=A0AA45HHT8_9BACT|nr:MULTISPECIES: hypothetical protein [Oceanotoga]MDN5342272.1 hypothetical protein [Oceanotoga sp.]MDO7977334.1 hypothetical protein [Oceanotoga teriensis]PWJ88725.1 hypothetical protein C7380_11715 [Oceanotoga teriensis]UYP00447.1 hypothetical protein OF820_01910 [Oceanotoga sp. DSM 15011]
MIGYFKIYKSEDEKFTGGILILNNKGLPVSFKYTEPIKPGKIQKIIYGKNLKSYLANEIIGQKVLENVENLEIIFINDPEIKDMIDTEKNICFINEVFSNNETKLNQKEAYVSISDNKSLKLQFIKEIGSDLFQEIIKISEIFDIYEPFQRLSEALNHICYSED